MAVALSRISRPGITALFATALVFHVPAAGQPNLQSRFYPSSLEDFPNPERGFTKADWASAAATRKAGFSLRHQYFRLDAYKSGPLPEAFLREVDATFASAMTAGVKLVPRFTYNFPSQLPLKAEEGDAALPVVLNHISQLTPVLARNADSIAFLEAGFIGAWGEWHHSTNGLDEVPAKRMILERLLKALPASRMVVLRYQRDKKAVFERTTPLTAAEAFSGTNIARVGHHNDCFLASSSDWDTYRPDDPESLLAQKKYLTLARNGMSILHSICEMTRRQEAPTMQPDFALAQKLPKLGTSLTTIAIPSSQAPSSSALQGRALAGSSRIV